MSVVYKTRWRLIYVDGRELDESPGGSTIMERWPNPIELQLISWVGKVRLRVPIPAGHKPIFYRRRFVEQKLGGQLGEPQLDAIVFGYGCESGSNVQGKLWMWSNNEAVNCPREHADETAIEMLLQA